VLGKRLFQQVPVKMSKTPPTLRKPGPLIGSSNCDVWQRLAGLSTADIAELVKSGVLWPKNMDAPPWLQGNEYVRTDANSTAGRDRSRGGV